jgi:DmsE family decaheme c-type cytochrome
MSGMKYLRLLGAVVTAVTLALLPTPASAQKSAAGFAGDASCQECHKELFAPVAKTAMGQAMAQPRTGHEAKGCETCHGPAKEHANSGGESKAGMILYGRKSKSTSSEKNATCLQCHEKTARTLWAGSTHESRNVACTDCHAVMHQTSEKGALKRGTVLATCGNCHKDKQAAVNKFAHMPLGEGKMECSSCHNPHGSPNDKMLVGSSVNETCFSCHTEKRGPFMWEHAPVTESCANCHNSHGSNKQRMLINALPRLCQNCHFTPHGAPSGRPSDQANVRFNYNKGCVNCHSVIHGSNHPAGAFFTR